MKTGFDEIDQIIGELPKGITVLGGGAGSGKTAFALDIVCHELKHDQVCVKRVKLKLIETKGKFIAADLDDGQVLLKDTIHIPKSGHTI